jgi:hypothetical protein
MSIYTYLSPYGYPSPILISEVKFLDEAHLVNGVWYLTLTIFVDRMGAEIIHVRGVPLKHNRSKLGWLPVVNENGGYTEFQLLYGYWRISGQVCRTVDDTDPLLWRITMFRSYRVDTEDGNRESLRDYVDQCLSEGFAPVYGSDSQQIIAWI